MTKEKKKKRKKPVRSDKWGHRHVMTIETAIDILRDPFALWSKSWARPRIRSFRHRFSITRRAEIRGWRNRGKF